MSGIALQPEETNLRRIVQAIMALLQGRSNAVGRVTLRAGFSTTVVTKATHKAATNMSVDSEVFYSALTANAAAIGQVWTSNKVQGGFTINHVNDARADKTLAFLIQG